MAQLQFRERREAEIRRAVKRAFRPYRKADHNRQPPWAKIRDALLRDLPPLLDRVKRTTARQFFATHAPDLDTTGFSVSPSDGRVSELVADLIDVSRRRWAEMGKRKSREAVLEWRKRNLGDQRAVTVAETEVHIAKQQAENAAWRFIQGREGKRLEGYWMTNCDLSKTGCCPLCDPLDGLPSSRWKRFYPEGPPVHPRCRCEIVHRDPASLPPRIPSVF